MEPSTGQTVRPWVWCHALSPAEETGQLPTTADFAVPELAVITDGTQDGFRFRSHEPGA